jgi:hypothetical protein
MKRVRIIVFLGLLGFAANSTNVWAQATAQISGTVRDQSGAVLPGVEVAATQTDTGIIRSTITNETGFFILPTLAVGPYRLEATLPGFRTFVQTGIVLQVNRDLVINAVLEVGQITEQVEVQANAALVETRAVGVGQVMENQRILELPLNGRNVTELILLSGASVQTASVTAGRNFPDRLVISTAGGLGHATAYTLDGINHIDNYDGAAMPLPFPDALEEFKVETSGLTAKNGRGSSVGAVTKSGTNAFHGTLFEFVRNDLFNARSYFATKGSTLKRNQFGGTLGGPVVRNKLFFFGGYQGTTLRQDPADTRTFVPTAAMLAGDFTAFASPQCNGGRQISLRAPFVNNRIAPSQFSPAALKLTAKLPKSEDPCGEFTYGRRSVTDDMQIVGRMDYQVRDNHSIFGRYIQNHYLNDPPYKYAPDNLLVVGDAGFNNDAISFTAGSTYLVSPNMVNAFRLGFNRTSVIRSGFKFFEPADIGINMFSYSPKCMNLGVTGGFSIGGQGCTGASYTSNFYHLSNDLSITHGTHQISFGGTLGQIRTTVHATVSTTGNFAHNGQVTGLGMADFLIGKPSSLTQGDSNKIYAKANRVSLYAQDAWQMTPRLTFNYGLRWAPVLPIQDIRKPFPAVMHFDINRYRQGLRSSVFVNAPAGMLYAGDPEFSLSNDLNKAVSDAFYPKWHTFGPRLGFAWDVEGNGRMSVRASYGVSYEEIPIQDRHGDTSGQPPWGMELMVPFPSSLDDPWRDVPGGNPFPLRLSRDVRFVPLGNYESQTYDITPTYTQSWNLTVQREVAQNTVVSASYIGSRTINLWSMRPLNPAVFIPGVGDTNGNCFLNGRAVTYRVTAGAACSTPANTPSRRTLTLENPALGANIGRMSELAVGGAQTYNGLLLVLQRSPTRGVTVTTNYTLSHCTGDFTGRTLNGMSLNIEENYQDPNDRHRDYGNCESDQRHSLNLTAVAETPQFSGRTLRAVATGWRLSGIYRRSTNTSLDSRGISSETGGRTVTIGVDRALNDLTNQRPNQVLENVYLDKSGGPRTQYLNPAAFALPEFGTLGNFGRVNIVLPTSWQFDMGLSRIFRFGETKKLEFRAEAYNVTNSFRPGNPNLALNSSTFGQIRTAREPRITQFALKYLF